MTRKRTQTTSNDEEAAPRKRSRQKTQHDLNAALESLKNSGRKISILAVAAEAGVSGALIHNKYPEFAEAVRKAAGKATRIQRDETRRLLVEERERNRQLRAERDSLVQEVRDLASENEALRRELTIQQAIAAGSVARLR